jgi:ABC transporter substrate binding protein
MTVARATLIVVIGLGLLAVPHRGSSQPTKSYRIGFLSNARPAARVEAFRQGLRELGYVEGRNVTIDVRSADGRVERLPELAAELVRANVDLILAADPSAAHAAKGITASIPIVMRSTGDPVDDGLVRSLAAPGGNVTGLASFASELSGKRIGILKEGAIVKSCGLSEIRRRPSCASSVAQPGLHPRMRRRRAQAGRARPRRGDASGLRPPGAA